VATEEISYISYLEAVFLQIDQMQLAVGECLTRGKMGQEISAFVWQEGAWFIAQCLEVDVASQGQTEAESLANLREALELYLEPMLSISN
jgi:predicted RNase H-like HicB family nuclease